MATVEESVASLKQGLQGFLRQLTGRRAESHLPSVLDELRGARDSLHFCTDGRLESAIPQLERKG